jgi:protein-disulfide isomerase
MTNARTARSAREKALELRLEAEKAQRRRRNATVVSAVIAVLVVVVGIGVVVQSARSKAKEVAAAGTPKNLVDGGIRVGRSTAPVTVTLFEDFQCPVCKTFEAESGKQLATWVADGTVKLDYRPIAILDRSSSTSYSTRSLDAAAAVVTASPSAFQKFHDLLYAQQPAEGSAGLPDSTLVDLAGQAGADTAAVKQALADKQYEGWAASVTDDSSKAGVTATPTVKVNGTELKDRSLAALTATVQAAQKAAG